MSKRLLAEWEKQEAIILAMPHRNTDWKPYLKKAQNKFIELIKHISRFQKVVVLYSNKADIAKVQDNSNVILLNIATNDTWCRDFAPLTLLDSKNNKRIMLDFIFNAWGMKYPANLDNLASKQIYKIFKNSTLKQKNFILEGGSIDSNGTSLLTTTKCLLEQNRNKLSKNKIEQKLKKYLHIKNIYWLESGELLGDDTDSHIDNLARFINKDTIVYLKCYDKRDIHYKSLESMERELQKLPFKLVPLPLPKPIFYKNKRLPASYVNFLFINNAILVPTFGDKRDAEVISIFKNLIKDREIIPIDSRLFIREGGGIHCLSMQIPALLFKEWARI